MNDRVYDLLDLRPDQRALVSDLVNLRMKLMKGKTPTDATRPPSEAELRAYARQLRDELDAFTDDQPSLRHRILVGKHAHHGIVSIVLEEASSGGIPVEVVDIKKAGGFLVRIRSRPNPETTQPMGLLRTRRSPVRGDDDVPPQTLGEAPLDSHQGPARCGHHHLRDAKRVSRHRCQSLLKGRGDSASGNRTSYRTSLVNRSHQVLKMGYDLTRPRHRSQRATRKPSRAASRAPCRMRCRIMGLPYGRRTFGQSRRPGLTTVNAKGNVGFRIDIEVIEQRRGPRPRFRFEAKRLRDSDSRREYLGYDGLGCFLDGRYAASDPDAGMIGYVQEGNAEDHVVAICRFPSEGPHSVLRRPRRWLERTPRRQGTPDLRHVASKDRWFAGHPDIPHVD